MFTRISFMLDAKGNYVQGEPSREVVASQHCAAIGFRMSNHDARGLPGQSLLISRIPSTSGVGDPWCDAPPTAATLFAVHAASVRFLSTVVEVVGFEESVLMVGGYMTDPWRNLAATAKKVKGPFVPRDNGHCVAAGKPLVPIHILLHG